MKPCADEGFGRSWTMEGVYVIYHFKERHGEGSDHFDGPAGHYGRWSRRSAVRRRIGRGDHGVLTAGVQRGAIPAMKGRYHLTCSVKELVLLVP